MAREIYDRTRVAYAVFPRSRRSQMTAVEGSAAVGERIEEQPHVLIVEDDPRVRNAYEKNLERAGFQVVGAGSLAEATKVAYDHHDGFDAAILDFDLPDGDAAQLVRPLLGREPLCKSTIITGVGGDDMARQLVQLGAHAYLHKPVSTERLLSVVTSTVHATQEWRMITGQKPARCGSHPALIDAHAGWVSLGTPPPVAVNMARLVARLRYIGGLTPVQTVAAYRLLWGDSDREIAEFMSVSERTAKHHVSRILGKTGARTRAGLFRVLLLDAGNDDPAKR